MDSHTAGFAISSQLHRRYLLYRLNQDRCRTRNWPLVALSQVELQQWTQLHDACRAATVGVLLHGDRALVGTGVAREAPRVRVGLTDSRLPALC